jgi:hypothetical protein
MDQGKLEWYCVAVAEPAANAERNRWKEEPQNLSGLVGTFGAEATDFAGKKD